MNYWINILQSKFSEQDWIILIIAMVIFFVSLFFMIILSSIFNPVRLRLNREINAYQPTFFTRYSLTDQLSKHNDLFIPNDLSLLKRTSQRLDYAGFHSSNSLVFYYALRMALMIFIPLSTIIISKIFVFTYSENTIELIMASLALGYLLPSFVLDRLIIKRQKILERSFPDALDMIVICSEAGLSLDAALHKVASVLTISHPELAAELGTVVAEMSAGIDRHKALKHLIDRTGIDIIRGFISVLSQSIKFGTSVADTLRIFSDDFRDKRTQAAESMAAKIGTKLMFPLAVCLLPALMIVILSPMFELFGKL
jgi:tight adherence protein C